MQAAGRASGQPYHWLLDIDGTLVFTDELYFQVFVKLLTPYGHVVDREFYANNVHGKVDADVFSKLMPAGTSDEELLAMSKRKDACFCELYNQHVEQHGAPMLNGLPEALQLAQQMGVRAIAVTNAQRGAGEASIASLRAAIPAASIIEGLVIGAECSRAKPYPDPYYEGMRQLGVAASDCIVFEDSRCVLGGLRVHFPRVSSPFVHCERHCPKRTLAIPVPLFHF